MMYSAENKMYIALFRSVMVLPAPYPYRNLYRGRFILGSAVSKYIRWFYVEMM